jgi:NAD(P) transhydrogenase subunit alpha
MILGILKEPDFENRVAILPEVVAKLVKMNVKVLVEKDAGAKAFAYDKDYQEAGAEIVSADDLIRKADVVIKINSPDDELTSKLREKQIFFAIMQPLTNHDLVQKMLDKGVTAFSFDMIPRTTRGQAMDILSSMATISGYKAVLTAANNLAKFFPMFMSAAGTIKPAKVLILGAGVAGLQAIATSRKLGGVVEVFDVRAAVKEEVMSLGGKFIEVEGAKDDASAGGYAVEQTEEFKKKQQAMIQEHAKKANVIICTAQIPGRKAPVLVLKDTVKSMLPGSVIIDLAASTGGNCELTEDNKTVVHNGVKIIGNSYFPSEMPTDASRMFGNNVMNFLKIIIDKEGNVNLDFEDEIVKGTCVTHEKTGCK